MTINLEKERPLGRALQSAGGEWSSGRDDRGSAGTSGGHWGTNGARVPLIAYVAFGLFVFAFSTVNALSQQQDLHALRASVALWKPFVWEYSSCAVTVALLPMIGLLLMAAPPVRGRLGRFAPVQGAGTVAYSLLHVGGFVVLRKLTYAALGQTYAFAPDLFYEYRKDVLSYLIALAFFALAARLAADRTPAAPEDATFDIHEGARMIRARVCDIVSASAAGNYVEFQLADGRRPLMRTTLAKVEAALAAHGLLRTHRSWLVNPARVRVLEADGGSGDYRLELDGGASAPLSRRFPDALERLRRPRSQGIAAVP